jgi:spermidine synthase
LVAPKSYWCVIRTLESAGFNVRPYHATVPSFGIWGYALASLSKTDIDKFNLPIAGSDLRFLNDESLRDLFVFPQDIQELTPEINRLDNQALVRYYDEEWHGYD